MLHEYTPLDIIKNVNVILGPDPDDLTGYFLHPKNYPAKAENKVNVAATGEVVMETDILSDGDAINNQSNRVCHCRLN